VDAAGHGSWKDKGIRDRKASLSAGHFHFPSRAQLQLHGATGPAGSHQKNEEYGVNFVHLSVLCQFNDLPDTQGVGDP